MSSEGNGHSGDFPLDGDVGKKKRTKKKRSTGTTTATTTTDNNSLELLGGGSNHSHTGRSSRSSASSVTTSQQRERERERERQQQREQRRTRKAQYAPSSRSRSPKKKENGRITSGNNNNNNNNNSNNNNNNRKPRTRSPKNQRDSSGGKPLTKHNQSTSSSDTLSLEEEEDEDFSIAPSLDTEVKSVVSKKFDEVYQRGRKLGLGAFAVVFIGTHRPTGSEYAVKQIDRSTMFWGDRDALQDEIVNLKMARAGPNIVQLYEVYEEKAFCYLIMEVMEGGELLECIIEKKTTFTEKEARSAVRCVLRALAFLHSNRVAHRDIKPENLLLSDPYHKDLNSVKLADFSFARQVKKRNDCRTLCGTPGYLSPEMLERFPAYDVKCDVWSVGCLLFLLLGGKLPFDDEDDEVVFDLTRDGKFEFQPEFWNTVSKSAKDLVTKMLTVNPKKRISASRALQSHWIEHGDEAFEERQLNVKNIKNLIEGKRKLKTAINTVRTLHVHCTYITRTLHMS